jgi:ABC-type bacteriocin/lantibiotic exporter with double-glycine peptidase domain
MLFYQILGTIILLSPFFRFQREIVEQLLQESDSSYSVICDNLKKVYHGKDGNAEKTAVTGLSLSMQRGQCFGILGPNGAGKTSLISMVNTNSLRCINVTNLGVFQHCSFSFLGNVTNLGVLLYTFV